MNRRHLLIALFTTAGASAFHSTLATSSEAVTRTTKREDRDLPAESAHEAQYGRNGGSYYYDDDDDDYVDDRRNEWRRRQRDCYWRTNRWGERVQVCEPSRRRQWDRW